MRRLTLKYAKPGMVVELPVYDYYGNLIAARHTKLEQKHIDNMAAKGVMEFFIRDSRVTDVIVAPLFSPQTEGMLASAGRDLSRQVLAGTEIGPDHLDDMIEAVSDMARDMAMNIIGDVNVSCHIAPQDYMYLQPAKTAALALTIGNALKLTEAELVDIGTAAMLKDIGLTAAIIAEVGSVAESDSPKLRRHPVAGYKLLMEKRLVGNEVAEAVLQHHEYWNGTGYPQCLEGEEISFYARIISVADAFVNLLAERQNGERYMPHEAIEYIMANSGDQFDPELVELVVRQVPSYPTGLMVKLNTGEKGIISDPKRGFVARPIVRICSIAEKGPLENPFDMDLSLVEYQRKLITKVLGYD